MTKEELLKPRKKVMIDFPQWSAFNHKKGDILTKRGIHWSGKGTARSINENEIDNYPEIFIDMEWWEDREEKDMPEYVQDIENPSIIYKVYGWFQNNNMFYFADNEYATTHTQFFFPITKEEYENQIK
jgi:hypothetical protein